MRVVVIAPGEMGAAIGARLRRHGAEVATSLEGRSPASAERARRAGLAVAERDRDLLAGADLVLSIVPPGRAVELARRLAPALAATGGRALYADCNAVAPATVLEIARLIAGTGCPFADVGIIGPPPREEGPGPRLYAAGEAAQGLRPLRERGLDLRLMEGGIGAASALKMAYATLTKGLTALGTLTALGGSAGGVAGPLRAELAASQPELLALLARQVPAMLPKAYRWVAEMEEIARFLRSPEGGERGEAAAMLAGAAALYAAIARDRAGGGGGEIAELERFFAPDGP